MKDIAESLGITKGLVSKVLSGRMGTTGASPRLQKRILKKAQELNYVPDRNAVGLSSGKKGTIGIFLNPWGQPGSDLAFNFLESMTHVLRSTTYHIWLNIFNLDSQFFQQMSLQNISHRVDGLIIGGGSHPKLLPYLRKLESGKKGVPVVTIFHEAYKSKIVNVSVNRYQQGRLPTELLISRGCRKIVFFDLMPVRTQSYRDALNSAGMKVNPRYIISTPDFSIESGAVAARKVLKSGLPFDGIVAQSDHQALGAIRELLAHGIRVPEQVRVTGVDDSPMCEASPVRLTSVTSESARLGSLVVETMLKKIAGEPVKSIMLEPAMVLRESA